MAELTVRRPTRGLRLWEHVYPMEWLEDVERWAGDLWDTWKPTRYTYSWTPKLDMYEEKDWLVMKWELPGLQKEDIDISLEGDYLTVKAERKQEEVTKDKTYYACETYYGTYTRTVMLPYPVDADKITATYEGGILELRLPKAEEAKPKHIEVKVK